MQRARVVAVLAVFAFLMVPLSNASAALLRWTFNVPADDPFAGGPFSIDVDGGLALGETTSLNPSGTVDGFTPTSLEYFFKSGAIQLYRTNRDLTVPSGSIAQFTFAGSDTIGAGTTPGTYAIFVSRLVRDQNGLIGTDFVEGGSLIITEVTEPASLGVLGAGLLGFAALRRPWTRRRAAR